MRHKNNTPNLIVRRLHPSDLDAICAHFQRLDFQSRRARFCGAISDSGVQSYASNIFRKNCIICGAFIDGQLRGLVELRGTQQGAKASTSEAAFSVELDWQNLGLGDALFDRIFAMAQNRGVRTLQMMCLKENSRMKHLALKHNAELLFDQDAVEAVMHPSWPTPVSMATEIFAETRRVTQALFGWRTA